MVDDVLIITTNCQLGERYVEGIIKKTEMSMEEDLKDGKTRSEVTMNLLLQVANGLTPYLKFTGEAARGKKGIPVLDTTVWYGEVEETGKWYDCQMEERTAPGKEKSDKGRRIIGRKQKCVHYKFYKKPMSSQLGTLRRSAVTENSKVATASSEFLRRWKNCSVWTDRKTIIDITKDYADSLRGMGYSVEWIRNVIDSSLTGYERLLYRVDKGEIKRNRLGEDTSTARRYRRLFGRQEWFKTKRKNKSETKSEKTVSS